jgi:hypothetical protein
VNALQSMVVDGGADAAAESNVAPAPAPELGAAHSYAAWRSMYPRWWFPSALVDHGLTDISVSTDGGDALNWHQYAATLGWETTQHEVTGSLEYLFLGQHAFALTRTLEARAWTGPKDDQQTTVYDRRTAAQWVSLFRWPRLTRRLSLGLGAALDRKDRVDIPGDLTFVPRDERIAAALVDFDTRGVNWYAEGANRGLRATLLYETYNPFASGQSEDAPQYDGEVVRADLRGYLPLGRSVLGLRWTEARAHGRTSGPKCGDRPQSPNKNDVEPTIQQRHSDPEDHRGLRVPRRPQSPVPCSELERIEVLETHSSPDRPACRW